MKRSALWLMMGALLAVQANAEVSNPPPFALEPLEGRPAEVLIVALQSCGVRPEMSSGASTLRVKRADCSKLDLFRSKYCKITYQLGAYTYAAEASGDAAGSLYQSLVRAGGHQWTVKEADWVDAVDLTCSTTAAGAYCSLSTDVTPKGL
jgi:hypothetical protein